MDDVWPPENATLHVKSGYDHGFRPNRGAGKAIAPDLGLFQTWQFSLYKNLMSRLRTSKQRTRDPSKASAFIVPFDAGVHSYIDHEDGHPRLAAPHGRYAGRYLRQNCQGPTKNLWWKNNGHDHFLIFSVTAYQMVGMMVKELFMFVCQNCTTIIIETTPTGTAPPGRTRKTFFAAPYPSSFHYWEGIKYLPWDKPKPEGTGDHRDILSLFIGSVKTSQAASRELRKKLFEQCQAEGAPSCEWRKAAHACNGVVNASDALLLFRRAQVHPHLTPARATPPTLTSYPHSLPLPSPSFTPFQSTSYILSLPHSIAPSLPPLLPPSPSTAPRLPATPSPASPSSTPSSRGACP